MCTVQNRYHSVNLPLPPVHLAVRVQRRRVEQTLPYVGGLDPLGSLTRLLTTVVAFQNQIFATELIRSRY